MQKIVQDTVKRLVAIILIFVMLFVLLAGITWFIFDDEGTWEEDERGNPSTAIDTADLDVTNGIIMDRENIINQGLINMGLTEERINELLNDKEELIEVLKMSEKLGRKITVNNLEECTEAELLWCFSDVYAKYINKPEELQYLIEAELVTQYPMLSNLEEDKLNGRVQFKRMKKDSQGNIQEVMLEYKPLEEYNEMYNSYSETRNTDIFNYFTINELGEVIIARWIDTNGQFESDNTKKQVDRRKIDSGYDQERIQNEFNSLYEVTSDTENFIAAQYDIYQITNIKINYKTLVSKYTLPFEYLWTLLVMGESYDFVKGLADLSHNAEIIIGAYDNINTRINTDRSEYTENFREGKKVYVRAEDESSYHMTTSTVWDGCEEEQYSYYYQEIVTYKTNEVQFDVLYADVWIVQVFSQYVNRNTIGEPIKSENYIPDEEWTPYGEYPTIDNSSDTKYYDYDNDGIEETSFTTYIQTYTYTESKNTNQKNTNITQNNLNRYEKVSDTIINPKTDIDPSTGSNFVKLLRNDPKAYSLITSKSTRSWLVGILEQNQDTINMVQLTEYLIEKTRFPDEAVPLEFEFNFDEVFQTPIVNSTGTLYGGSAEEKVWCALRNAGFSEIATAAVMGNIYVESDGFVPERIEYGYTENNGGIGLCQWTNNNRGPTGRNTNLKSFASSKGSTWQDVNIQVEFLLAELTGQGDAAPYASSPFMSNSMYGTRYTRSDWENATDIEVATRAFCATFERPGIRYFHSSMGKRVTKANEYFALYNGMNTQNVNVSIGEINTSLSQTSQLKMTQMLNDAIRIANDDSYTYEWGAKGSSKEFDCSGFVYWLYRTYFNINVPVSTRGYSSNYIGRDGQVELKAGDVLWKNGHVAIYVGNGVIAEAWGENGIAIPDQVRVTNYQQGRFTKVYRFITN